MHHKGKIVIVGLVIGIVLLVLLVLSAIDTIRPADLTRTRLTALEWRIRDYVGQKGAPPRRLSDLPKTPGKDDAITDGWGHEIVYTVDGKTITLTSYGKDGLPGGAGENADMTHRFVIDSKDPTPGN